MADVLEVKRKHYSGLDADKAGITGTLGDTYAANDSGKSYYWNDSLSAWKTGLGYEYVPRDVAAPDKQVGDFVTDLTWKIDGLDLSGIVPAGAVAVHLRLTLTDDASNKFFGIRKNVTQIHNEHELSTQVANVAMDSHAIIKIDPNRLLDYRGSATAFTIIDLFVLGWWI